MGALKNVWLIALLVVHALNGVTCQSDESEESRRVEPNPVVPVVAQNPPDCVDRIANGLFHLTRGTTEIVKSTVYCAKSFGWFGQTIYANKLIYPFHNGRVCAAGVFKILAEYSEASTDFFNADTVCRIANTNPRIAQSGCGQVITAAMEKFFDALEALTDTASACAPPGTDPPYYSNDDIPVLGFVCWERCWRVIERALVMGKNIDEAIKLCPRAADERYDNKVEARDRMVQNIARDEAGLPPLPWQSGSKKPETYLKDLADLADWRGDEKKKRKFQEMGNWTKAQRDATPPPALVRAVNNSIPTVPPTTPRPSRGRESEQAPLLRASAPAPAPAPAAPSALSAAWDGLQHPLAPLEAAVGHIGASSSSSSSASAAWASQAAHSAAPAERRRLGGEGAGRGDGIGGEALSKLEHLFSRLDSIRDGWVAAMELYEKKKISAEEPPPRGLERQEAQPRAGSSSSRDLQI